ncbi:MAG: family 78 glycoside hydrolase catalytic domain [Nibricoccus sp.]
MTKRLMVPAWGILLLVASCFSLRAAPLPISLRCEYRTNPAGIGETHPRLNWTLQSDSGARGIKQTAYQILAASSAELLAKDKGDLWNSGAVKSDNMQVEYAGRPLRSRDSVFWKVRIWDEKGKPSAWSSPAHWSIGLIDEKDWQAQWIGLDDDTKGDAADLDDATREQLGRQPWVYADIAESKVGSLSATLRQTFVIEPTHKPKSAILAVVPDQRCTIILNGKTLATLTRWHQLLPLEITPHLVDGSNVIGLEITQHDGYRPAALGAILLSFDDGSQQNIPIDTSWKFSNAPEPNWKDLTFDATAWKPVISPPAKRNPWDGPPQTFTYRQAPAPLLRKAFSVHRSIKLATIYSTALGAYELHLNGQRVGRDYLTPGWTDFNKRVQYQTHDVTAQLRQGKNVLGAVLGDGWYASVLGYTGKRYFYGGYPRFLAQLEIEYTDGSRAVVSTDKSWLATNEGPVRAADIMQGCVFDHRLSNANGSSADDDVSRWEPVQVGLRPHDPQKPLPQFKIEAANAEPSRIIDELSAKNLTEPRYGAYTFDLGQNMVGWVRLKVKGSAGQQVVVRHGEALNPDGSLYTSNLRGANATDTYLLKGGELEVLEPAFTFHGFRYVEVTGLQNKPSLDAVTGIVVHSDIPRTGNFECSNPLINQLYRNIIRGQKGNYVEVPTDCPQRDERAGWTGDAQFFVRTGTYNFDISSFMARWLTTVAIDSQLPEGSIANVAPAFGGLWASPGWGGDAAIICTHELYRTYGDKRVVSANYDSMAKYLVWLGSEKMPGGIRLRELGDHLNLGGGADLAVLRVAHLAHLNELMAEMAAALGKNEDSARYAAAANQAKVDFQRDFVQPDGSILNSSQSGYALAFSMNLLRDEQKPRVAEKFVDEIKKFDWHLATGFIGTPRLLPALHISGRDDVAYKLLLQETFPSWLFQVKNGATTIWERWDGWTPDKGFQTIAMNSFNHYAFGSVGEFMYRQILGIEPAEPGFKSISIRPAVGHGLTWAHGSYDSVAGRISTAWKLEKETLTLDIEIPANSSATVYIPSKSAEAVLESGRGATTGQRGLKFVQFENDTAVFQVDSGSYHFSSPRSDN